MTVKIYHDKNRIETLENVVMIIDDDANHGRRVVMEHNYIIYPFSCRIEVFADSTK